jgi:hypothetical protein
MLKSSDGYHWVLRVDIDGEGERFYYVKVLGHLPAEPIRVTLEIQDVSHEYDNLLMAKIEAVSAVASVEEVLDSGNYLKLDDKQLVKWNGGDEREDDDNDDLKNLILSLDFDS